MIQTMNLSNVNVVRSILYFYWATVPLKMPSFHLQEYLHALAHKRGLHHHLAGHLVVSAIDLHVPHPPNTYRSPQGIPDRDISADIHFPGCL